MSRLKDKRVLLTDCEEFMGPAIRERFAARGADVIADSRYQAAPNVQAREIFGDIARHASGRDANRAGVRVTRTQRRVRPAVYIDVGPADDGDQRRVNLLNHRGGYR